MNPQELQEMKDKIEKLIRDLEGLTKTYYHNNFTSSQDFTKETSFQTSLKIPHYATLPTCDVGQIAESGGKLYICSAVDTWTIVGTQS
jgi:hypothetical protein